MLVNLLVTIPHWHESHFLGKEFCFGRSIIHFWIEYFVSFDTSLFHTRSYWYRKIINIMDHMLLSGESLLVRFHVDCTMDITANSHAILFFFSACACVRACLFIRETNHNSMKGYSHSHSYEGLRKKSFSISKPLLKFNQILQGLVAEVELLVYGCWQTQ